VVALPAHTCDSLQPLDVCVFGPFKHYKNRVVAERTERMSSNGGGFGALGSYDVIQAFLMGYSMAFTTKKIISGFAKRVCSLQY